MNVAMVNRYQTTFLLPIDIREVNKARLSLDQELKDKEVPPKIMFQISLALDEAMTNAIEHGASNVGDCVELAYRFEEKTLELSVTDSGGIVFNPEFFEQLAVIRDWGTGGRGIFLIKNYMDEVYFVFSPGKSTRIIMRKSLIETGE